MSKCYIHANLVKIRQLVHEILCTQASFGSNLAVLSPAMTLKNVKVTKIKSALHHVPMLYPCKSDWNPSTSSWDMVHTHTFGLKFGSLSPAVTLKIRSRSQKPDQLIIMSQCYIHANLLKIHPPVHDIVQTRKCDADADANRIRTKNNVGWLCWGLTSQSTIFQSCRDGAIASWVINQYFRGVKCLAQGHNTAAVGLEPRTSRSGVRHSTTEPPRSPKNNVSPSPSVGDIMIAIIFWEFILVIPGRKKNFFTDWPFSFQ